jgi:hypothetical protein
MNVLRIYMTGLMLCLGGVRGAAQEAGPPRWDARGVGPLPRMGVTSLDVSDDGKEIAVGTIAPFGDPNVVVLSDAGKVLRQYKVGQQWIDGVAFVAGTTDVLAVCTMPAGKAGDRVEVFRCRGDKVVAENTPDRRSVVLPLRRPLQPPGAEAGAGAERDRRAGGQPAHDVPQREGAGRAAGAGRRPGRERLRGRR